MKRTLLAALSFALLLTGCPSAPPADGGASGPIAGDDAGCPDGGDTFDCCDCIDDFLQRRVCGGSTWVCPSGTNPMTDCPEESFCRAGLPGPSSSLKVCADPDAGVCLDSCEAGEVCFTQVACGPLMDGGSSCGASGEGGDNRCHLECQSGAMGCGPGEVCVKRTFFACTDFNGSTAGGRNICCAGSDC